MFLQDLPGSNSVLGHPLLLLLVLWGSLMTVPRVLQLGLAVFLQDLPGSNSVLGHPLGPPSGLFSSCLASLLACLPNGGFPGAIR